MVSALTLAPTTPLTVLRARAPWFERLLRVEGVRAYSPIRIDSLSPVMETAATHADSAQLIDAQWQAMFRRDPGLYLRVRAQAARWVFLSPSVDDCVLIYTGVSGPDEEMADLGLAPRKSARDDALDAYAMEFAGTPLYSHAAFGALGLLLMVRLLLRRQGPDIAVLAMLASAGAFAGGFLIISIACDYRYLYDLDLAVIAAALYCAATWRGGVEDRSALASRPGS